MISRVISRIVSIVLVAAVAGLVVLAGYFWYKSGQPMQVEEAQRIVPGITFREFWQSRVVQWRYWDGELQAVGKNGTCENSGYVFFAFRAIASGPFVIDLRAHENDKNYTRKLVNANNGVVPPHELIYRTNIIDAWWAMVEHSAWHQYADNPGFPVKALGQRRACSTTYPTAAVKGE